MRTIAPDFTRSPDNIGDPAALLTPEAMKILARLDGPALATLTAYLAAFRADPADLGEVRTEYRLAWQRHDMTVCDGDSSISDPEVSEWRSSRPAVPVNSEIVYVIESRQVLTSTDPVYGLMRETEVGISDAGHSALGFGGGVAEVPAQSCEAADLLR